MSNLIGIAPLQSPTFGGTATFNDINLGYKTMPDGTSYTVASAAASGVTSIVITGVLTLTDNSIYYISGTGIADGTTIVSITPTLSNTTLTISTATTAALTTTSTVNIVEIPEVKLSLFNTGSDSVSGSIISHGEVCNIDINASQINLYGSSYAKGGFNSSGFLNVYGDVETYRSLNFNTGLEQRFTIQLDNSTEGDGNTGSNFSITGFDNTGVYLNSPLTIERSTGKVTIADLFSTTTETSNLTVTSNLLAKQLSVGTQTMTPVSYTVAYAAASGATSIIISGSFVTSDYATYYVTGVGIASGTLITASSVNSAGDATTLTLSNAITADIAANAIIDIATNYQIVMDYFASGNSTPDASIGVLGGYGSGYSGTLAFVSGTMNFSGSSDVNFSGSEINFKSPSYFQNSVYVGSGAASDMESLNFLTSGDVTDYDARIFCQGGSATSGSGLLTLQAGTIALAPGSGGFNIESSSFNLGLNQTKAGATFINFFSNGDNDYADFTLQSYGGATGAAGGATVSLTCSMLQMECNEVDMTNCSWGVMVPTPGSTDTTTQKAVNMAYLNSSPTLSGGLTITDNLTVDDVIFGNSDVHVGSGKWLYVDNLKLETAANSNINILSSMYAESGVNLYFDGATSVSVPTVSTSVNSDIAASTAYVKNQNYISTFTDSQTDSISQIAYQKNSNYISILDAVTGDWVFGATQSWVSNNFVDSTYGVTQSGDYAGKSLIWGNNGTAPCFCYNNGSSDIWVTLATQSSSDPALKENMVKIESKKSLDSLSNIDLYSYDWKDKKKGHVPVGFNSKNLLEVWPETIQTYEQVEGKSYQPDTVNLLNLIARLTDCIKELKSEIDDLKSKYS